MSPNLELLTALFVHVRRAVHSETLNPRRQRNRSAHLSAGPLRGLHNLLGAAIQHAVIKRLEAYADILTIHGSAQAEMLATTPAPTVLPPSRIANRSPSSIAIGAINVTSMLTLSPGITISTPSGNVTTPVTSVVRK